MNEKKITQEERDLWRFESADECGTPSEEDERILRLLNALETTEALLDGSVQETRANFSAVYQACTEIIPDLKVKLEAAEARAEKAETERKKDLAHCKFEFERAEAAEAEVARLTKERDWLAQQMADVYSTDEDGRYVLTCPNSELRAVGHDCDKIACPQCWAEAARKSVAGEG